MNKLAAAAISRAKVNLILDHPFFGHPIMSLDVIEDPSCPACWTDGRRLGYNPDFILTQSHSDRIAIMAHEATHVMLGHPARMSPMTGIPPTTKMSELTEEQHNALRLAQFVADMIVDPILATGGIAVPPHGGVPNDPANAERSMESLFAELKHQMDALPTIDCPWGEVRPLLGKDGGPPTPEEIREAIQDADILLAQSAQVAKAAGLLPGGLDRYITQAATPKINWRDALRQFVDRTARDDYSWSRASRRWLNANLYLPSMSSDGLPLIAVAIDTSGSISQSDLAQFSAELSAILGEYRTSAIILYVDTEVAGTQEISTDDLPISLTPKGGGGTDFRPPFIWLEQHDITPACMIYLTDLGCNSYPDPPDYPTLWAHIGRYSDPPFGECVEII